MRPRPLQAVLVLVVIAGLFGLGLWVGTFLHSDGSKTTRLPAGRVVSPPSALAPLAPAAFRRPVAEYRRYVARRVADLARAGAQLSAAARAGDRASARAAWRRAYLAYGRMGAAYGAFGSLDAAIDGTTAGLPGGARNPRFAGLHRIERVLFGAATLASVVPWTARLQRDVARLRQRVGSLTVSPLDYAIRAHEILEDAKRDQLGAVAVGPSGEGVLGLAAAVQGTDEVLSTLAPLLAGRAEMGPVATALQRLRAQLAAVRHGKSYPVLSQLTRSQRELLQARTDAALELLARIPSALETVPLRAIPAIGKEPS